MYELTKRIKHAAESILENERLTADLDDAAAKVLLDWGVACAEKVAGRTDGLNDSEADEAMSPQLRATRRLMRRVNQWVTSRREMDAESSATLLGEIIEQATIIYGKGFTSLDSNQRDALLKLQSESGKNPSDLIADLRELLEKPTHVSIASQGESYD